jgi:hypothetical protein
MHLHCHPLAGRQCRPASALATRTQRIPSAGHAGPSSSSARCRSGSFELDEQITAEDAAKFERIAASLVAKYSAEDGEDGSAVVGAPQPTARSGIVGLADRGSVHDVDVERPRRQRHWLQTRQQAPGGLR